MAGKKRASGPGLHRESRRQSDRRRLCGRYHRRCAQRRIFAGAVHGPDVHRAAEHLRSAGRHRHLRGSPVVRSGGAVLGRERAKAGRRSGAGGGDSRRGGQRRRRQAHRRGARPGDRAARQSDADPPAVSEGNYPNAAAGEAGSQGRRQVSQGVVRAHWLCDCDRRHTAEPRHRAAGGQGSWRVDALGVLDRPTSDRRRDRGGRGHGCCAVDQPDRWCIRQPVGRVFRLSRYRRQPGGQRVVDRRGVCRQPFSGGAAPDACERMNYEHILFAVEGGVARLTLKRPDRLNSFNDAMHAEVRDVLSRVKASNDARVLLLTGAGRGFCAGQDLGDRAVAPGSEPVDLGASIERNYKPLVLGLRALPLPVVCAVNGVAAGAGANIALACDIVIAAKSASFIQAFSKIGLIPDSGGTYFLPRLVGSARAMGLAMLGDKLSAEQAAAWGLIWKCVDDAEFPASVEALVQQLSTAATRGLAATKQAIYAAGENTLEAQLDLERDVQRELGRSADYREGVSAFAAKRPPKFSGT